MKGQLQGTGIMVNEKTQCSMKIQYENLTIRQAEAADAKQLAAWWNDGAVRAHAGFPNGLGYSPSSSF